MIARSIIGALALLLAVSLLGNVLLWQQRTRAIAAELQLDGVRSVASACSDATDDLRSLADQRAAEARRARATAALSAQSYSARADATLSQAPVPGADVCTSLQTLGDEWLRGRVLR